MFRNLGCIGLILAIACFYSSRVQAETYTDFEQFESGTLLRDQLHNIGLRFLGVGYYSGRVQEEGEYGVGNYGNSPTHIVNVGSRDEPTTIQFVDPNDPNTIIGADYISLILGDGHTDTETVKVDFLDPNDNLLSEQVYTTHTVGTWVEVSDRTFGSPIGSIVFTLLPSSQSGSTLDDLSFILTGYCTRKLLSDLNNDCRVNFFDLAIMASEWLSCGLSIGCEP